MQFTTIFIAAIATATLAIVSPVAGEAAVPPPALHLDCLRCKTSAAR
jgi:hypothetical protein